MHNKEITEKFPPCEIKTCPFCGCMMDNTCKIENVIESAPWLISEHVERIDYCDRPELMSIKSKELNK